MADIKRYHALQGSAKIGVGKEASKENINGNQKAERSRIYKPSEYQTYESIAI